MALATPLEIPFGLVFNSKAFDVGWYQQISPGGAGFVQTIQRAEPLWWAEYSTPPLNNNRYDSARGFLDLLEGAVETFLAYDPDRIMPRAHQSLPVTADPWTQSGFSAPQVTAVDYAASTLTINRLNPAAVLTAGDYISFQIGKIWYLFRVCSSSGNLTWTPVGNTSTIVVKPRPNLYTGASTLPANIRYRRACFQAKIIGGVKEDNTVDSMPKFNFKCFQMLDRSM